jgi:hypothetical protein
MTIDIQGAALQHYESIVFVLMICLPGMTAGRWGWHWFMTAKWYCRAMNEFG